MNINAPSLRQRLQQPGLITAPGVHDMVSLRMADAMGFDALYMTGFGTVASHLGLADAGLATYTDMVGRVRQMASMARTPLIADGDTGYGGGECRSRRRPAAAARCRDHPHQRAAAAPPVRTLPL